MQLNVITPLLFEKSLALFFPIIFFTFVHGVGAFVID